MAQTSQKSQSQTEKRIGRALVQYFKPVIQAKAHHPGQRPLDPRNLKKPDFRLLQFGKKKKQDAGLSLVDQIGLPGLLDSVLPEPKTQEEKLAVQDAALPPAPDKLANWIEIVIYLVHLCRRASAAIKTRNGVALYRKLLNSRGQRKLKAIGTIVDTVTDEIIE